MEYSRSTNISENQNRVAHILRIFPKESGFIAPSLSMDIECNDFYDYDDCQNMVSSIYETILDLFKLYPEVNMFDKKEIKDDVNELVDLWTKLGTDKVKNNLKKQQKIQKQFSDIVGSKNKMLGKRNDNTGEILREVVINYLQNTIDILDSCIDINYREKYNDVYELCRNNLQGYLDIIEDNLVIDFVSDNAYAYADELLGEVKQIRDNFTNNLLNSKNCTLEFDINKWRNSPIPNKISKKLSSEVVDFGNNKFNFRADEFYKKGKLAQIDVNAQQFFTALKDKKAEIVDSEKDLQKDVIDVNKRLDDVEAKMTDIAQKSEEYGIENMSEEECYLFEQLQQDRETLNYEKSQKQSFLDAIEEKYRDVKKLIINFDRVESYYKSLNTLNPQDFIKYFGSIDYASFIKCLNGNPTGKEVEEVQDFLKKLLASLETFKVEVNIPGMKDKGKVKEKSKEDVKNSMAAFLAQRKNKPNLTTEKTTEKTEELNKDKTSMPKIMD